MRRPRSCRRAALAASAGALALAALLACLTLRWAVSRPASPALRLDSPPIAGHVYSLWVLPCDAFSPGQAMVGRDLWIFSSYPPPGPKLILAPPCP
jgi:hypothetical protein